MTLYDMRGSALLHPDQHCTHLILNDMHWRILHGGVSATLAELRERCWLLRGCHCVKAVISKCRVYKQFRHNATSTPTAPFPKDIVPHSQLFQVSGVNFVWLVFVRGDFNMKAYTVVFTCVVVHLDLCNSTTVNAFVMAFRHFVVQRGTTSVLQKGCKAG
uniref:Tick transposon n=1 Tax=Rhipicephalus appendiculatus TaxID=34631 RepID=A0A131YVZ5_RHIAP